MSILDFLFGSNSDNDARYSDTNEDGDEDAYIYRLESDGSYTPVSKVNYKAHTDQLFRDGYYDHIATDNDEPKKHWWSI